MSLFIILLALLLLFSWAASRAFWNALGGFAYSLLFWPGVLVHELSHVAGAALTLTRIRGISLLPRNQGTTRIFGSVEYEGTKNPFKLVIISSFPIAGGVIAIHYLAGFAPLPHFPVPGIELFGNAGVWKDFLRTLAKLFLMSDWRAWAALYLALAISAHLAPSAQDLRYAAIGGAIIGGIAVLISYLAPSQPYLKNLGNYSDRFAAFAAREMHPTLGVVFFAAVSGTLLLSLKRMIGWMFR